MSREVPGGVKVTGYVLGLALAFVAAFGVGKAVGPLEGEPTREHGGHGVSTGSTSEDAGSTNGGSSTSEDGGSTNGGGSTSEGGDHDH